MSLDQNWNNILSLNVIKQKETKWCIMQLMKDWAVIAVCSKQSPVREAYTHFLHCSFWSSCAVINHTRGSEWYEQFPSGTLVMSAWHNSELVSGKSCKMTASLSDRSVSFNIFKYKAYVFSVLWWLVRSASQQIFQWILQQYLLWIQFLYDHHIPIACKLCCLPH